jgi:hypothetical protein
VRFLELTRFGSLLKKPYTHIESAEEYDGDHNYSRPANIPLGAVDFFTVIFPDPICEAIEHGNLLKRPV